MLKQMREKTKIILWIVVVAFVISIFAVWGMNLRTKPEQAQDRLFVGKLDGEDIPRRVYSSMFNDLYNQVKMQRGENYTPTENELSRLTDQAWEMTIQKMLVSREIQKLNITVTDEELVTFLRRNPHPSLRNVFKTEEGQFDYAAYLKALSDPEVDWSELERWGRSVLPEIKLESLLAAQINIPEREARERFMKDSLQVRVSYIEVPLPEADSTYRPTEEEILALYEESREDFKEFDKRRIRVIEIDKTPTEADELDVKERLLEIREEILGGADFAEAARNYSDDHMSAQNGGDLGFFGKGAMVPEFETAASSLDEGEISEPVRTDFGYHLIRVEEKKIEEGEEKVHASHILLKLEPGYETIDSLRTLLKNLSSEIQDKGFEKAAGAMGLAVKEPPPFSRGSFIPELGYLPRIVNFAFNHSTGSISSVLETESSIYFVKIIEEIPGTLKPLEDVQTILADRLQRKTREEAARETAMLIRQRIITGGNLESAAHSMGLQLKETPLFRESETVPGIGVNTAFATASHLLHKEELSAPVKGPNGYYLIIVTERIEPDMNKFASKRADIMQQLRSELTSQFMAGWYDIIRKRAEVVDLRESTLF